MADLTPGTLIGTSLSHYRVTAKIGEGGMGEVYRATDDNLGRDVAIKVLPEEVARDPERLARFKREAHLLASLNHTNIAAIHGLEEVDDKPFLVLELVEGEDLSERLERGPIPVDDALDIARQVAEALEEAHGHGIVHRDLKPANIKLTAEGRVKVLDFGLAKAFAGEEKAHSAPDLTQSPTMSAQATQAGVILGTAAYMSPEQARGKPVDKRADIWAFGVVLFEMLTGKKLFAGETVSDVLAAVLTRDPAFEALPQDLPASAHGVLERCLVRDPAQRMRDIGDARLEMDWSSPARAAAATPAERWASRRRWILLFGLALFAATFGALANQWISSRVTEPRRSLRLAIPLAASQRLLASTNDILVFSPDGRSLAFPVVEDGHSKLMIRSLEAGDGSSIEGTDYGSAPFFSPDGRWVGVIANNRMIKVPVEGGQPIVLGEQHGAGGAWWADDGTIIFAPIYSDGLFQMPANGGEATRLTTPDRSRGELGHWWPQLLPDGRHVLFTGFSTPVDESRVGLLSLDTGEIETLVERGFFGRYVPSGHLLFAREQRLFAMPFDLDSRTVRGTPQPVLDDVYVSQTGGYAAVDVSAEGTLAYMKASVGSTPTEVVWVDRDGRATVAIAESHRFEGAALSPDGRNIATTILRGNRDIWIYSTSRRILSRLTSDPRTEYGPVWSRDGSAVFFILDRPPFELHRIRFGSAANAEPVWSEPAELDTIVNAVTPDGDWLLYSQTHAGTGRDLWMRRIDGSEAPRPLRATGDDEESVTISGDGRWIAYESHETGRPEIYVEAFPGPGERFQISTTGGQDPVWASESDEVFYRQGDSYWVVKVSRAPAIDFSPPEHLFDLASYFDAEGDRDYDVTPDGRRLLIVRLPEATIPRRIDIITNWLDELKRLVPVDGS